MEKNETQLSPQYTMPQRCGLSNTLTVFIRLMVPERITAPVRRQIAVSKPPSSSASSDRLSRPFTRLTVLYNSTNDLGSFTKQLRGAPGKGI